MTRQSKGAQDGARARLVRSIVTAIEQCRRDPVRELEAAVATIRNWNDIQWAQVVKAAGLRTYTRESREPVIAMLRERVSALGRERECS